jgi:hypothetical protein
MSGGVTKKSNLEEYQPSAAKGKNKVYQSVVRFIPWHVDPKKSIMEKWTCWLVDPLTTKGKFIDCPSSIGKPSPLQDMYWKLKKSESVQQQKAADIFSRRHAFASLVQVIKDDNQPELEGKILVWRYGKKVWDKINGELKPLIGDPHNPFDLIRGKLFALVVTEVSGFNNYDQSKFLDKSVGLCMINDAGKLTPITDKSDKGKVLEFLKESSPDLNKFGFKEWDADTHDYVNTVITQITGKASVSSNYASVSSSVNDSKPKADKPKSKSGITSTDINLEDLDMGGTSGMDDLDLGGISGNLDDALAGL